MIAAQAKLVYQLNKYYTERCQARKAAIAKTIREVCKVVSDVLKEVEVQEPRFISSLSEIDARYEGLEVISPTEFEVVLYLNQMGVFNFVDDGSLPGCAVLKLSDGRKRSMSLWVEFITASGYLSARKIRSRFQTLVAQAVDKCSYRDVVKMIADTRFYFKTLFLQSQTRSVGGKNCKSYSCIFGNSKHLEKTRTYS